MSSPIKKILVLSSGGDAPGMNAAIRAVVRSALHRGIEVYGCERGFAGLNDQQLFEFTTNSVANIIQRGGTILKTARYPEFKSTNIQQRARDFLKQQSIDGLVVLGGNGSFQGAYHLAKDNDLKVIGIPCTIDCDIVGTEYCIGFDTACNTAIRAIDNIRDTAQSHDRNFIIEVMGKNSGFLATHVGIATGAELILIPEEQLTMQGICQSLQKTREKLTHLIVAAEADKPGRSFDLAKAIEAQCNMSYKVCVLGHIQRGGSPTGRDRVIASLMGAEAVELLLQHKSNRMVAFNNNQLTDTEFPNPDQATRAFDQHKALAINTSICH